MKIEITKGNRFITLKISHSGQIWHKFLLKDEYQLKAISNEILNFLKPTENVEMIEMKCLGCGKMLKLQTDSNEAAGIFNVFCPGGECEDRYSARL